MQEKPNEAKWRVTAGRLVASKVIRAIKDYCFENNLLLDIQQDNGFFSITYYISIYGNNMNMAHYQSIDGWLEKICTTEKAKNTKT